MEKERVMTGLRPYEKAGVGSLRAVEEDGQVWFVAKDICDALGYSNARDAISTHVDPDDALKRGIIDALGRIQETTLINESGMYALVFGSRLERAREFKRWVTSEVLPSIRRTGRYEAGEQVRMFEQETEWAQLPFSWCNGELAIPMRWLLENKIASRGSIQKLACRGGLRVIRRGCRCTPALVAWESLPQKVMDKICRVFGPSTLAAGEMMQRKMVSLLADVCRIKDSELRLSILSKIQN